MFSPISIDNREKKTGENVLKLRKYVLGCDIFFSGWFQFVLLFVYIYVVTFSLQYVRRSKSIHSMFTKLSVEKK